MRFNENLALRPVLMQSETWIEKPVFDRSKTGFLMRLNKRLFNSRFVAHGFQLDQTVEKTWIFKLKPQLDSCIGNVFKSSCRILVRVSHAHTPTQHATRPHTTTSATLAWLLSLPLVLAASQRDASRLRPSAARDITRRPRCAVSVTLLSTNCCAGCSFDESRRIPGPRWDEMEKNARV